MNNEERLNLIMQKQSANEAARIKREQREKEEDERREALGEGVKARWTEEKAELKSYIDEVNLAVSVAASKVLLFPSGDDRTQIDAFFLALGEYPIHGSLRRCDVRVLEDGTIRVRMGTLSQSGIKHYELNAMTSTQDEINSIVLDFLEVNC